MILINADKRHICQYERFPKKRDENLESKLVAGAQNVKIH